MPDVSFNEPQYRTSSRVGRFSKLESFVIRMGLAKDSAGAQKTLLVVAVTAAILAALLGMYALSEEDPNAIQAPETITI